MNALPPVVLLKTDARRESLRWAMDRLLREMRDPQPGSTLIAQQVAYTMPVEALRLHAVADIEGIQDGALSISSVASSIGYKSDSAFSAAFTRRRDSSPREHLSEMRGGVTSRKGKPDFTDP